ncbi:hypothetical protein JCM11251_006648 [Rhodosporidiobolus azoricus]
MPRASKSTEADEPLSRQSLKSAVWYTIAQEEELSLPFAASEHFVASLAEVVFQQALSLGKDLERFAKHAGRMTINVDDVKLAARRNEPLYDQLCTSATQHGLALSDFKADQSKPKKAPRASSIKTVPEKATTSKSTASAPSKGKEKEKEPRKTNAKSAAKGKGKEKAAREESDPDEDDNDGAAGGFLKASLLKGKKKTPSTTTSKSSKAKGKARAVPESDADELEDDGMDVLDPDDGFDGVDLDAMSDSIDDDGSGGESDASEEVGRKRKGGKKDVGTKAKRRRSEE